MSHTLTDRNNATFLVPDFRKKRRYFGQPSKWSKGRKSKKMRNFLNILKFSLIYSNTMLHYYYTSTYSVSLTV